MSNSIAGRIRFSPAANDRMERGEPSRCTEAGIQVITTTAIDTEFVDGIEHT